MVAGVGRALEAIEAFTFDDATVSFLLEQKIVDQPLARRLAGYRFTGSIWGYPEGEIYFPGSPLMIVEGSFAEAVILETVLLSIYNYDSAVASASVADDGDGRRPAVHRDGLPADQRDRRRHQRPATAYVAGFSATSNLEAGRRYGVPTGTTAHSFTLLHGSEREAFGAQIESLGEDTTLLVDTYDIEAAVRTGIELTNGRLGAIRLDSGDLAELATQVRQLLDSLGATHTRILVTSDLDEWQIAALRGAPVDGFGVGTSSLVTGSGAPTCGFVYKLVARAITDEPDAPLLPVAKSVNKTSIGGRKIRAAPAGCPGQGGGRGDRHRFGARERRQ